MDVQPSSCHGSAARFHKEIVEELSDRPVRDGWVTELTEEDMTRETPSAEMIVKQKHFVEGTGDEGVLLPSDYEPEVDKEAEQFLKQSLLVNCPVQIIGLRTITQVDQTMSNIMTGQPMSINEQNFRKLLYSCTEGRAPGTSSNEETAKLSISVSDTSGEYGIKNAPDTSNCSPHVQQQVCEVSAEESRSSLPKTSFAGARPNSQLLQENFSQRVETSTQDDFGTTRKDPCGQFGQPPNYSSTDGTGLRVSGKVAPAPSEGAKPTSPVALESFAQSPETSVKDDMSIRQDSTPQFESCPTEERWLLPSARPLNSETTDTSGFDSITEENSSPRQHTCSQRKFCSLESDQALLHPPHDFFQMGEREESPAGNFDRPLSDEKCIQASSLAVSSAQPEANPTATQNPPRAEQCLNGSYDRANLLSEGLIPATGWCQNGSHKVTECGKYDTSEEYTDEPCRGGVSYQAIRQPVSNESYIEQSVSFKTTECEEHKGSDEQCPRPRGTERYRDVECAEQSGSDERFPAELSGYRKATECEEHQENEEQCSFIPRGTVRYRVVEYDEQSGSEEQFTEPSGSRKSTECEEYQESEEQGVHPRRTESYRVVDCAEQSGSEEQFDELSGYRKATECEEYQESEEQCLQPREAKRYRVVECAEQPESDKQFPEPSGSRKATECEEYKGSEEQCVQSRGTESYRVVECDEQSGSDEQFPELSGSHKATECEEYKESEEQVSELNYRVKPCAEESGGNDEQFSGRVEYAEVTESEQLDSTNKQCTGPARYSQFPKQEGSSVSGKPQMGNEQSGHDIVLKYEVPPSTRNKLGVRQSDLTPGDQASYQPCNKMRPSFHYDRAAKESCRKSGSQVKDNYSEGIKPRREDDSEDLASLEEDHGVVGPDAVPVCGSVQAGDRASLRAESEVNELYGSDDPRQEFRESFLTREKG